MHAVVMIYGDWLFIQEWIQAWRHTYLPMIMTKKDCDSLKQNMACAVRQLPFGIIEIVFPKENADLVLTSLRFHKDPPYKLDKKILGINPLKEIKKYLSIEDVGKFDSSKKLIFPDYDVSIIPIGVRYDGELTEKDGPYEGYTHEAL
jgi:hypothetical protein